jgi:hypothetical protein
VHYQNDAKFTPISLGNIESYVPIGSDDRFSYFVKPQRNTGFIFQNEDLSSGHQHAMPVMTVSLRNSGIGELKQAYELRIRGDFSRENLTTSWYVYFVNQVGGIVSDCEHLQGGKVLWKAFIKIATADPELSITLLNKDTGTSNPVTAATPDAEIWSVGDSKKNLVLVFRRTDKSGIQVKQ